MNWKDTLRLMKLRDMQERTPGAFAASGGFTMKIAGFNDNTANSLTKSVVAWINYSGGTATRINTMGVPRTERIEYYGNQYREKITFTPSATRKGTADIQGVMNGRHLSIEVKIGKDQQSEHQIKEQERITSAGGLYFVARDMQSFIDWFKTQFPNKT